CTFFFIMILRQPIATLYPYTTLFRSWETDAGLENTIRALGDEKSIYPTITGSFGVSRKLSERVNIGLEHQVVFNDNDLLDGFEYRSNVDRSANIDIIHYTSLSIDFNLGSFDKRTEPLHCVNTMSTVVMGLALDKSC